MLKEFLATESVSALDLVSAMTASSGLQSNGSVQCSHDEVHSPDLPRDTAQTCLSGDPLSLWEAQQCSKQPHGTRLPALFRLPLHLQQLFCPKHKGVS